MLHKQTIEEMRFLLEEAEEKISSKIENILFHLYWSMGYCLKDYNEEEIALISKELACLFRSDAIMFETAYYFYKANPMKRKLLRVGA